MKIRLVEWFKQESLFVIADGENGDHAHLRGDEDDVNSLSLESCASEQYEGPFDGVAVALRDSQHSPYDRHALKYKVTLNKINLLFNFIDNMFLSRKATSSNNLKESIRPLDWKVQRSNRALQIHKRPTFTRIRRLL